LVVGDFDRKQLYAIRRVVLSKQSQSFNLEFTVTTSGHQKLMIWCMSDSYVDVDKEVEFEVDVQEEENVEDEEMEE
jgi:pre-mRNA-splicing helicase BRR2